MAENSSVELTDDERDEFLGRGGTGVVSFPRGDDDPPYSLPVSYGYDADEGCFYFRLAFGPDAGKDDVVDDGTAVSFVTADDTDAGWRSVVATGRLEAVSDGPPDPDIGEAMERIDVPLVDVFDRNPKEVTFRFFRLDPDEMTGRKEAQSAY